jgi:adenylate cyclase
MARLILATAEGMQAVDLRPMNSLGRHPSNSIQLLDKIVSKEHCLLELRGPQFVLRDLGSLNGTFVNSERVRGEQVLRHGDEIALGSTRARFDDGSGPIHPPAIGPGAVPTQNTAHIPGPANAHSGNSSPFGAGPTQGPRGSLPATANPQGALAGGSAGSNGPARAPSFGAFPQVASAPPRPVQDYAHGVPGAQQHPPLPRPLNPLRPATLVGTRVDMLDSARAIERQINARTNGFAPFDQVAHDPGQLRLDYERLRITWEMAREIAMERDLDTLLDKILRAVFKFVKADRGVILLKEKDGTLQPKSVQRRDGTDGSIEVSSTILNHAMREKASVLTHDASTDFAASKGKSMILNRISSAMVVPLLHEQEVLGAIWLDSPALAQFQQKDLEVITAVANQAAMFIENTLLTRKIEQEIVNRERFSRLLSPNVAEQVLSGRLEVKKGGVHVEECTVFNSDIRGFTRMSEGSSAEVMVEMLNEYFEQMVETIFKFEGTLDKFMGDGIMAFWGAPVSHVDDAARGVSCALEQMDALARFNRQRVGQSEPPIAIGIGIHTGPVVAGYVGSSKALSYTVIGDTANTSSRICGIALPGQVVASESTLALLGNRFEYEELPAASLKGKERPLRLFNILRERPSASQRRPT